MALALLAFASLAQAGIVDPSQSSATIVGGSAVLLVAPGGAESFVTPTNHTIDVFINDFGGQPVEVVASDIWLLNVASAPCPGGWIADSSTFAPDPGHTTFTATPRGGVKATDGELCYDEQTDIIAVGQTIQTLDVRFVSADLTGDGAVDVADFGKFGDIFNVPYDANVWCGDLVKDYVVGSGPPDDPEFPVDVADFGLFATFFNLSTCP